LCCAIVSLDAARFALSFCAIAALLVAVVVVVEGERRGVVQFRIPRRR
jgi:hypothetical protein